MDLDLALKFELGDAAQIFAQDFFFDFELLFVGGVLVMTSSAAAKMRTRRRLAVRGWFDDCIGMGAGEARLFFGERGFDFFPRQNEGDEDSFAASAVFVPG
jgi:hypothetical protein